MSRCVEFSSHSLRPWECRHCSVARDVHPTPPVPRRRLVTGRTLRLLEEVYQGASCSEAISFECDLTERQAAAAIRRAIRDGLLAGSPTRVRVTPAGVEAMNAAQAALQAGQELR
jgi:hypothetical protein